MVIDKDASSSSRDIEAINLVRVYEQVAEVPLH